jgi:hypothetical protein
VGLAPSEGTVMKKLVVLVCALGCGAAASAQENSTEATLVAATAPQGASNTARLASFRTAPNLASLGLVPAAPAAMPKTPTPDPAPHFGLSEEDSWQLSVGYAFVRFRSTPFDSSLNGMNTTVVKYFNEWFAAEGTVTAAFAGVPSGFGPKRDARYVFYGGGVRIKQPLKRFEPWGHVVVGGIHMQPQTAAGGRSTFAFELGGGVDWRWRTGLAWRVQGDWVRSQLYQESQNNFQIATGIVFIF